MFLYLQFNFSLVCTVSMLTEMTKGSKKVLSKQVDGTSESTDIFKDEKGKTELRIENKKIIFYLSIKTGDGWVSGVNIIAYGNNSANLPKEYKNMEKNESIKINKE